MARQGSGQRGSRRGGRRAGRGSSARRAAALVAVAVLLTTGACAGTAPRSTRSDGPPGTSATSVPVPSVRPPQDYCTGVDVPAGAEQRVVTASDGSRINSVWLGSGARTAVLLHQTDGNGLCGMLFFADYLARHDVRAVALDLCGYGQSLCRLPAQQDPVLAVEAVTRALRSDGAARVVLVGASMGGSLAVHAGAAVDADAVVDLSGPATFDTSDIEQDAPRVTMPILIAFGEQTDPADLESVQAQMAAMPTAKKTLLRYEAGHGVDLLLDNRTHRPTTLAAKVLVWVKDT